jgi:exonuclease VII small subunit
LETWALKVLGTIVATAILGAYTWLWNTNNTQTQHEQRIAAIEAEQVSLRDAIEDFEEDNELVIRLEERLESLKTTLLEIKAAVNAL